MLENIYKDAGWEAYYDMAIIPLFKLCCKDKGVKIIPVHATRKSGRKPLVEKKHFIETNLEHIKQNYYINLNFVVVLFLQTE